MKVPTTHKVYKIVPQISFYVLKKVWFIFRKKSNVLMKIPTTHKVWHFDQSLVVVIVHLVKNFIQVVSFKASHAALTSCKFFFKLSLRVFFPDTKVLGAVIKHQRKVGARAKTKLLISKEIVVFKDEHFTNNVGKCNSMYTNLLNFSIISQLPVLFVIV
jgi:hypothetical protein